MYFREIRELATLCFGLGYISAAEFAVLLDEYESCNPDFPYDEYMPFNLDDMDESECLAEFRFEKQHIPLLAEALRIPAYFITSKEAEVAYPCRYNDMIPRFARPVPVLSMVTNKVINHLYETHGHRLTQWNHTILHPQALEQYAEAIHNKGAPLQNCFGFIDGTVSRTDFSPKRESACSL
ncbi:Hypothetical predicted protein [Paramuricea clavata]|uniref:Uncharacterized protein n=1 Tax=Paramuricea clavata TaxID=317549 RepID=A0A6S7FRE5_PARCT|nr:Hypothetical predicted protein [Paramuricea clavata]